MFNKGDFIVYGVTGICEILDVTSMSTKENAQEKLYYILRPYKQKGSKIFTPIDNKKTIMRRIISQEEAEQLIAEIPEIDKMKESTERSQEELYKKCIKSCECREWVRLVKTLYHHKQKRTEQGKKISATDEKYMKIAKENLLRELSIALGYPEDEIDQYLTQQNESCFLKVCDL